MSIFETFIFGTIIFGVHPIWCLSYSVIKEFLRKLFIFDNREIFYKFNDNLEFLFVVSEDGALSDDICKVNRRERSTEYIVTTLAKLMMIMSDE